jgi:phenylacetate-CoA ligase
VLRALRGLSGLLKAACLFPLAEKKLQRSITPRLRILRAEAVLPFSRRKALARQALVRILAHAGRTVPYYRDLFSGRRFNPEDVNRDIRYFEDLPLLTKAILLEQAERLISEPHAQTVARRQKTGSSTGPAATVCYNQEDLDWTAAQNILMLEWGGKRRYDREVHLSTRFPHPPSPADLRFERRKCFVLNRRNVYTDGFGDAAQETLLADLRRAGARVVQGHPSSLHALARHLEKNGRREAGLFEIFVSTGEMITAGQREIIENVFSARVSNRYGACEFGVMAQERVDGRRGELMVHDSVVWPEVLPVESSEAGELVFTGLRNMTMPLIRYRMGDLGLLEERDDGWWVTELTGRVHDRVEIDGTVYPTHYVQDILDRCGPVSDFQIVARAGKAEDLRLVSPPESWEAVERSVRAHFPHVPLRRITPEELVFVGVRGKFSYLLREEA